MNPTEIVDQAVPLLNNTILQPTGSYSNPVTSYADASFPDESSDTASPPIITAQEVESQSFDSGTKRIKGAFEFESLGSLRVGQFQNGVSGEITISPSGINAIDSNGNDSFILDGEDGSGTFFGTVKAEGFDIIDTSGLISINNFENAEVFLSGSPLQSTSSTSFIDITGSSLDPLVLGRESNVLLGIMIAGLNDANITSNGADYGQAQIYSDISGTLTDVWFPGQATTYTPDGLTFHMDLNTLIYTRITLLTLPAGTHNLKLQMRSIGGGNSIIDAFELFYVVLGN